MNALRTFWSKLRSLVRQGAVKREIDEELRFHIEQRTAENIAAGMPPSSGARVCDPQQRVLRRGIRSSGSALYHHPAAAHRAALL